MTIMLKTTTLFNGILANCQKLYDFQKKKKYESSWFYSIIIHAMLFLPIPMIMHSCDIFNTAGKGMKGDNSNKTKPEKPVVVVIKPPREVKPIMLNYNSPLIVREPELTHQRSQEMDQATEKEYESLMKKLLANNNGNKGNKGTGADWVVGMGDFPVRFIRLRYAGGDWGQDMGKGADYNLLLKIMELVPSYRIADNTEAIYVNELNRYKSNRKPPFVYLTGSGNIHLNSNEIRTLREYLIEDGGMIFADNGGGNFNYSFRQLVQRLFPDKQLRDIANDDPIYQYPFSFPNGAPPLWHHSGYRSLGLKHNGRWIVFYHQGDINDAWKTGGSGISEAKRNRAFKLGINVMCYSYNQYMSFINEL